MRKIHPRVMAMDRKQLVEVLEGRCCIQCYDHETLGVLRDALQDCIRCGDISVEDLP